MAIRDAFISRFVNGLLVEVDYSQLEIYALAWLSGDSVLRDDLLSGKDLHGINAEMLFGPNFTDKERTYAKRMSFQLQYGAGYKNMAKKLGLPEETTKQFIDNYYNRYQGVKKWQDEQIREAKMGRVPSQNRTKKGLPAGEYTKVSVTGRRYYFLEEDAPEWDIMTTNFRPTTLKNYPVQGFATGDIVPVMLGKMYVELKNDGIGALMVSTTHDSIGFDCPEDQLPELCTLIRRVLGTTASYVSKMYDIDFKLKLPFEISVGKSLNSMEKILDTDYILE